MQPWLALLPIELGALVPCIAYTCPPNKPIHLLPKGLFGDPPGILYL